MAPDGKIILTPYQQQTPSGLDVEPEKGEPRAGIVYAFGKPLEKDPQLKLKVGQKVCIKKYVSSPFYMAQLDKKFVFVDYDDICAVVIEDDKEKESE